jgi:hypothetical protein
MCVGGFDQFGRGQKYARLRSVSLALAGKDVLWVSLVLSATLARGGHAKRKGISNGKS